MKYQLINIKNVTNKELRFFGIFIVLIIMVVTFIMIWTNIKFNPVYIMIGIVLFGGGIVLPVILKPIYFVWMTFASIMGWFMTRLILCFVFYVVTAPIGLIMRLYGNKFLELKIDKSKKTYWNLQSKKKLEKDQYEKQY